MRGIGVAVAVLGLLTGMASGQVVNPRVTTDSSIDTFSAETVLQQILKPGMTDEEKAVACWRFMLDHFYHWYPPREPDANDDCRDFTKMINSHGFGPCFVNAPVLTDLWEAAGFKTRSWTVTGHSIPEVYYGGAWHMLDADARAFHRKADGQIASVEELAKDMKLFTNPPGMSTPFYPFGAPDAAVKPLDPWGPASKMMDLYASTKDNYRYNKRAVLAHPMYLTLRPGERITLNDTSDGKFFNAGFPKDKLDTGPVEINGRVTYGNGQLVWEPDFKTTPLEMLLWKGSSNVQPKDLFGAADPVKPMVVVVRVLSPYVLVTSEFAARVSLTGASIQDMFEVTDKATRLDVSTDEGRTWSPAELKQTVAGGGTVGVEADLTAQTAGRYAYLVRLTLDPAGKEPRYVTWCAARNLLQLAPLSLPRLKPGKNTVTVLRGPDEGVVSLTLPASRAAKEPYITKSKGCNLPKAIQPANENEPGYVVYKLTAPDALTALSVGAHLTLDQGKGQHIEALYSLDGGKSWTSVWKLADNDNPDNALFEEDRKVTLENPAGAKDALIKFSMLRTSKTFSVNAIRLYAYYRQTQPNDARLRVDVAWEEKSGERWVRKERSETAAAFPHVFALDCGGEVVRLRSITMTPAAPGASR